MTTPAYKSLAVAFVAFAIAGTTLFLGLGGLGSSHPLTVLHCERERGTCRLTDEGLFGSDAVEFPVQELAGTQMRVYPNGTKGSRFQILLVLHRGGEPLELGEPAYGQPAHEQLANQIQQFIDQPTQPTLEVRRDARGQVYGARGMGSLVGILFVIAGLGQVVAAFKNKPTAPSKPTSQQPPPSPAATA